MRRGQACCAAAHAFAPTPFAVLCTAARQGGPPLTLEQSAQALRQTLLPLPDARAWPQGRHRDARGGRLPAQREGQRPPHQGGRAVRKGAGSLTAAATAVVQAQRSPPLLGARVRGASSTSRAPSSSTPSSAQSTRARLQRSLRSSLAPRQQRLARRCSARRAVSEQEGETGSVRVGCVHGPGGMRSGESAARGRGTTSLKRVLRLSAPPRRDTSTALSAWRTRTRGGGSLR